MTFKCDCCGYIFHTSDPAYADLENNITTCIKCRDTYSLNVSDIFVGLILAVCCLFIFNFYFVSAQNNGANCVKTDPIGCFFLSSFSFNLINICYVLGLLIIFSYLNLRLRRLDKYPKNFEIN